MAPGSHSRRILVGTRFDRFARNLTDALLARMTGRVVEPQGNV